MLKYTTNILIDRCLWKAFNLWLFVDSINGFFLNEGKAIPISLIFKALVLVLILFKTSKIKNFLPFVVFSFFYTSIVLLNLSIINEEIAVTLLMLVKLFTTISIFLFLRDFAKKNTYLFISRVKSVLIINFIVFSSNIILGLLGYGYNSYGEGNYAFGAKGFFYAANELAGVIVYLFPIMLYMIWGNYRRYYFLCSLFFVGLSLAIGTKSCIISVLFLCLFIAYYYGDKKCRGLILFFIFTTLICMMFYLPFLLDNDGFSLFVRLSSTYEQGGIESLIFSGRDNFVQERTIGFFDSGVISQIFGLGGNRTVEMDPYDVMLNFGYLGITLIYSAFGFLLIRSFRLIKVNSIAPLIFISNFLVLFISTIAGHIIFSSMTGLFFAIINAFGYIHSSHYLYWKDYLKIK